ncbi:hypothetical protein ACGFSG_33000 [Streptomyces sp. NPDC048512]|uniref:hypothetical protein n=1 Tax=unclassified Streptomyces TaxID=2593676 RepID=UPI0009BF5E0B|nr:hypothetical protein [Streptomyces sp. M41(2017)]OQQ13485.1 hypothetical protein B0675_38680 [Streptomyces sp. M41(2017)]
MTVGGWCRTLRAGVFAAACVVLAALGHVMMSGAAVPGWTMAAGAVATAGAGWFLAGRERGRALIVTVVVTTQAALHEMFALAGRPTSAASSARADGLGTDMGPMDMSRMDMGSMGGMAHGTGGAPHAHTMVGMGGSALGMPAAHLLAAALCGLWLAYGERAVFRLLRAAAARLAAPLRMLLALPVPGGRPPVRARRTPAPRASLARFLLCYAVTSRGPPVGTAVA